MKTSKTWNRLHVDMRIIYKVCLLWEPIFNSRPGGRFSLLLRVFMASDVLPWRIFARRGYYLFQFQICFLDLGMFCFGDTVPQFRVAKYITRKCTISDPSCTIHAGSLKENSSISERRTDYFGNFDTCWGRRCLRFSDVKFFLFFVMEINCITY